MRLKIILILLVICLTESLSYFGLFAVERVGFTYRPRNTLSDEHVEILERLVHEEPNYMEYSPSLGWTIRKNGETKLYKANSAGIRSNREYDLHPGNGVIRISTFGDSFTHGSDVKNHATWQAIMESNVNSLEVLNFGVGGYGLDQAYLRYLEDGKKFHSHIVLVGFMSENIHRVVNRFRPFYFRSTQAPFTKPRFKIEGEKLSYLPNPIQNLNGYEALIDNPGDILPRIGRNDFFYQIGYGIGPMDWLATVKLAKMSFNHLNNQFFTENILVHGRYNEASEAFQVTTMLFDAFYSEVLSSNTTAIILIFPNKKDISQYLTSGKTRYFPLISYFESKSYAYFDLIDVFKEHASDLEDLSKVHYTELGNRLVAQYLISKLKI